MILLSEKPRVRQLRDGSWALRWKQFRFVGATMDDVLESYWWDLWGDK
jgi:hypothetical protein